MGCNHFWKRRQIIAAHIRGSLSRRQPSEREGVTAGVSSAISPDAGGGQSGSSMSGRNTAAGTGGQHTGCQDREGEVGLTGIICRYDDDDRPQSENEPLFVET
ncbi:hypothetical protein BGZ49_005992 [Haplosporangium sp. Z 27]|nr:hypothetical protein BGZ49_005992 [Haplosporangium sp. Z 27]